MTTTCIHNHVLIDANGHCHCPGCKGKSQVKKKVSIKSLIKAGDALTDLSDDAKMMCMAIIAAELDCLVDEKKSGYQGYYESEVEWFAAISKKLDRPLDDCDREFCFSIQDRVLEDFLQVELEFGPPFGLDR